MPARPATGWRMKAAIYARFSTDLQNERSIDDQVALCRAYAARDSLVVVATFDDRAKSGASTHGRGGLLRLMDAARAGQFKAVIVEALDRLSRDQEDLAGIWKRLKFAGVEIRAVHEGRADAIQVGVRGLVGALYLQDLAHKVHRGMAGVVRSGRHAGGLAYGYRPTPGQPGELAIVEDEALAVRRIFAEYLDGASPRDIAGRLNRAGIAPPRGKRWNASTIVGSASRGCGILHNELYAGRIAWNKVRMVRNPETGRRISRPNPREQWQIVAVPQLAIVAPALFAATAARLAARSKRRPETYRRPRYLMSGLLTCSVCGGGMARYGSDRTGRARVRCSTVTESGSCTHGRSYYLDVIERTTVAILEQELRDPRLIAEFVKTYREERKRLARQSSRDRGGLERELGEVTRALRRMVDALADGLTTAATIRDKLLELEDRKAEIEAQLAMAPPAVEVVTLHPAAVERYLAQIQNLAAALSTGTGIAGSSAEWFRDLVANVIVHPVPPRAAPDVEVRGYLAELLNEPGLAPNGRSGPLSGGRVASNRSSGGPSCTFRLRARAA